MRIDHTCFIASADSSNAGCKFLRDAAVPETSQKSASATPVAIVSETDALQLEEGSVCGPQGAFQGVFGGLQALFGQRWEVTFI